MIDNERLQQLLEAVPASSCEYQEWVNIGMALHNEGLPVEIWDRWSAQDAARYHRGECERKWRTFGNGSSTVTIGSLYHMAEERGYIKPYTGGAVYNWDDMITTDGDGIDRSGWHKPETIIEMPEQPTRDSFSPMREITDYLTALFDTDEYVSYVNTAYQDEDGRWKPSGGVNSRTCGELLASLKKHPDITDTFGTPAEGAGTWVCFNPMDGKGRSNGNVSSFRYALVESDTQSIEDQYALLQDLKLPIKVLVHSGGKSLHAIVSIGACDQKQYQERVDFLYTVCRKNGLIVDTQDKNPARLSRFPGFRRGDRFQYIVAKNIGLPDFVEWQHYIQNESVEPLEVIRLKDIWDSMPPVKPVLIDGVLRCGHKMMVASSSKAGKTFLLLELAISIAEGHKWLGLDCRQGRVLYINMELDGASFDDRIKRVYEALEYKHPHTENIDIVHLRGKTESLDNLIPKVIRTMKGEAYAAVIIDPIYKLGIGDENAAEAVTKFVNAIDKIANCGASIIYVHHHSKGMQGEKASMDRAAGSGVFARDADAMIDLIETEIPEEKLEAAKEKYGEDVSGWKIEFTLREFARREPMYVLFSFPIHVEDTDGILAGARLKEVARAMAVGRDLGNAKKAVNKENRKDKLLEHINRDISFGAVRSVEAYADEMKTSVKTIRNYLDELGIEVRNSYPIIN